MERVGFGVALPALVPRAALEGGDGGRDLSHRGGELVLEVPVRLAQVRRVLVRRRRAPADPTLEAGARVVQTKFRSRIE